MTATARLDLRLNPADKARISRAADLRGVPLSTFVRDAVLRETENVMAAELSVALSAEESRRFLAALDKPSERYVQQALAAMALALKDPKRPRSVIVAHWDAMQGVDWDDVLELRN